MARFLNVVLFNPTAGGTTDFTVSAAVQGYMTPNAAGAANGAVYRYRAENATLTEWEVGYGTYNTGTGVLTRTVVLYNSLGTTAKINFTAAPNVGMGMPLASDIFPFISDTPPTDPDDGALWWESDTGVLYIYYNDGSSKQWVGIQSQSNIAAVLFTAQSLTSAQQNQAKANLNIGDVPTGSGELVWTSATVLTFRPKNGNKLKINGVWQTIPAAGITIGNGGLAASTFYWLYAYMNAGVMTLEVSSSTGNATDVSGTDNTGTEIKSGDATRSFVGILRTNGSTQFVDSDTQRFVRSWFNRRFCHLKSPALGGNTSLNTGALAEVTTGTRVEFISFGDEVLSSTAQVGYFNNTAGDAIAFNMSLDGASNNGSNANTAINGDGTGAVRTASFGGAWAPTAGYHYMTITGNHTSGTASIYSSCSTTSVLGA